MRQFKRLKYEFSKNPKAAVLIIAVIAAIVVFGLLSDPALKTEGQFDEYWESTDSQDELKLHFIDVGQGDCTLIESADGKFMLIDCGFYEQRKKVCDYLENAGVEQLEYVVFTHPHEDHLGSGNIVVENFEVKQVLMPKFTATNTSYEYLIDALGEAKRHNGTKITSPKVGEVYEFSDDASFEILSDGKGAQHANNASIVFRFTYGDCSFMFSGDAETEVEEQILSLDKDISCVLYKCAHHGSSTSNSRAFVKAVSPKVTVISCAKDNDYGHPHVEIRQLFDDLGVKVFRTDELGDILFGCDKSAVYLIEN